MKTLEERMTQMEKDLTAYAASWLTLRVDTLRCMERLDDIEKECQGLSAADSGLLCYVQQQVKAIRELEQKVSKMQRIVC